MLFSGFIRRLVPSQSQRSLHPSFLGPHLSDDKLDIIIAYGEGMFYSVLQSYITDFMSVLELVKGLGNPDYIYKRKVKKGACCADISMVLAFLILKP